MLQTMDPVVVVPMFFMITTILFVVVSLIFINRSKHLKRKISAALETLAARNKELSDLHAAGDNILLPFISETARSIIVSIDADGKVKDANDYALEVFGYTADELIGHDAFGTIFPLQHKLSTLRPNIITRILTNPKLYIECDTENTKKSGEHFWISWTNRVIYGDSGHPIEIRLVGFDITKRKQLEEELRYLATIDPLTGVLNRQALLDAGAHELKRAIRYKRQLSILVLRMDYFHSAGDSTGFSDEIIRKVIATCRANIRDSDCIGRVGDVEFAIILPETSAMQAMVLAERLKDKIQSENLKKTGGSFVSVGFGLSEKKSEKDTIDGLMLSALNDSETKEDTLHTKKYVKKGK